jgi:hypothetical protein
MRAVARGSLMTGLSLLIVALSAVLVTLPIIGPASAAVSGFAHPSTVLVNQPVSRVCVGKTFKVGVWYQRSGGSRIYHVSVYNPSGHRVFYRQGRASSAHWTFWHIRARVAGKYRTVYHGYWKADGGWAPYRAFTTARSCS